MAQGCLLFIVLTGLMNVWLLLWKKRQPKRLMVTKLTHTHLLQVPPCQHNMRFSTNTDDDLEYESAISNSEGTEYFDLELQPLDCETQASIGDSCSAADHAALANMHEQFPSVPLEELLRFFRGAQDNLDEAVRRVHWMLAWREEHPMDVIARAAAKVHSSRFVISGGLALDGSPIVLVQSGCYDPSLGNQEDYVLACVALVDELCLPGHPCQITVLHDLRPGVGWPNCNVFTMLPFVKAFAPVFAGLFPERLKVDLIYPLPWWADTALSMAKALLDPKTASKLQTLRGADGLNSPVPITLGHWISYDSVPEEAKRRHSSLASFKQESRPYAQTSMQ